MSSLNDSTLWVFTNVEKLSFSQVKERWIREEQYFKDLSTFWLPECWLTNTRTPLSDMLGSGKKSCSCRWRGRYSRRCWRLQGNVEEGHLSGVGGGGRVTSRQDLATDLDVELMSLPEASMYIEESDYSTSYLEAWQARTVRESKTEQRTASLEQETVLASWLGVRSLPTSILLTPNSWH